ncbi:MAG: aminotransferase class III-fold pyridoxal phosphate-dependent enzyme, partial [Myxococcota bacterium]
VATARVADVMQPGTHGTTYGGSPLACIAGVVVMNEVAQPGFMDNVVRQGQALMDGLDAVNQRCAVFSKIRGRGLMIGAQLSDQAAFSAKDVVAECRKEGVLVHVAGQRVLRLVPPLILEANHVAEAIAAIEVAVTRLQKKDGQ